MQEPDNWQDHKKLNELNKEKTITEQKLSEFQSIQNQINDIGDLISISVELGELDELEKQSDALSELNAEIDSLETKKYFSRETDSNNAFLDIQSGSGGTEAQDWAEMLYRMYTRWAEDMNFKVRRNLKDCPKNVQYKGMTLCDVTLFHVPSRCHERVHCCK